MICLAVLPLLQLLGVSFGILGIIAVLAFLVDDYTGDMVDYD